ncbi:MAG: hypothetical protein ACO377_14525 [Pseudomonadales bacterium]|jgi:hypothetical protein
MDHQQFAELLGNYGEFVGAIAVFVTLVYLAIQIRQNTESLRIASELALSQQSAEFIAHMRAQPEVLKLWDLAITDPKSMSVDDIRQFRWAIAELFLIYEGHYHVYKRGFIAEEAWQSKANMMRGMLESPIVSEWWSSGLAPFTAEFVGYVQNLSPLEGWTYQPVSSRSPPNS